MRQIFFITYIFFNIHYFFKYPLIFVINLVLNILSSYDNVDNVDNFVKYLFYIANCLIFWMTIIYSELHFLFLAFVLFYLEYNFYIKFIENKYRYIGILILNDLIFNIYKIVYDANILGTYLFYTNHHKLTMLSVSLSNIMVLNSIYFQNNSISICLSNILCFGLYCLFRLLLNYIY
jgi:hypothetical protein